MAQFKLNTDFRNNAHIQLLYSSLHISSRPLCKWILPDMTQENVTEN